MTEPRHDPIHGTPYLPPYPPPPVYQEQVSAPPHGYGVPPQATRADLQPYVPPPAPVPYGQPYPMAQVAGHPLVSAGGRLGAALLDVLLALVTLWIGWLVWSLITWSDGQTPAKKLLGHVVADGHTGQPLDWGRMALRELCIKGLLGWLLNLVSCGVYSLVDSLMVFGDRQRTLHDRMANSVVRHG